MVMIQKNFPRTVPSTAGARGTFNLLVVVVGDLTMVVVVPQQVITQLVTLGFIASACAP
jgi:hypothetical protein